jgi:very-long-chain (3R)-3-hydroxyacyl-CoA dehydratase
MAVDTTSPRQHIAHPSDNLRQPPLMPLQATSLKKQYLILYNFGSAILWLVIFGRVVQLVPLVGFGRVYAGVGIFAKWVQSIALLEIAHAATGM